MIIKFKLSRTYTKEAIPVRIKVGEVSKKVFCPAEPAAEWALLFGSGYSPLFYEDQSAVLGNYKVKRGTAIYQLLYDLNNHRVVTEFVHGKKGMCKLLEIVETRITPGQTLLK